MNRITVPEETFLAIEESNDVIEGFENLTRQNIKAHIKEYEALYPRWTQKARVEYLKDKLGWADLKIMYLQRKQNQAMDNEEITWAKLQILEINELKADREKLLSDLNWTANKHLYMEDADKKGKHSDRITDSMVQRAKDFPFDELLRQYGWKGKRQLYMCELHGDKDPSFHVRKKDNRARCWGCGWKDGKYADTIDFVMEVEKCTWKQAVMRLQ